MCYLCLRNLQADIRTKELYATMSEAALFAYFQRDEDKIARRVGAIKGLLEQYPDLKCVVHLAATLN